jgi:uncharacterized membrane protein YhaH (DUF805 family)
MKRAVVDGFKRWRDFSGRSTRAEFWWFQLLILFWPCVTAIFAALGILTGSRRIAGLLLALSYPIMFLVFTLPSIAVSVRRMHDVGKSGWFNLVPFYSLYLHLQPAKELGRIPGWIFAERTALVLAGLTIITVLTDGVSGIIGFVFWSAIYLGIRFRNVRKRKSEDI